MELFEHVGDTIIIENENTTISKGDHDDCKGIRTCYGKVCIDPNKHLKHFWTFHHIRGYSPVVGIDETTMKNIKYDLGYILPYGMNSYSDHTVNYAYRGADGRFYMHAPGYSSVQEMGFDKCCAGKVVCMLLNDLTISFCILSLDSYKQYKSKNIDDYPWKIAEMTIDKSKIYRMFVSIYDSSITLLDYKCCQADVKEEKKETDALQREKEKVMGLVSENNLLKDKLENMSKIVDELQNEKKSMEMEILTLKEENKNLKLKTLDVNAYKKWNKDEFLHWIISLDGAYKRYESMLKRSFTEQNIDGSCIDDMENNDLMNLGIKDFKHRKAIMNKIKSLIDNKRYGSEGATAYI